MAGGQRVFEKAVNQATHRIQLQRFDWYFSQCPADRIEYCFHYEFARECSWIVGEYRLALRFPRQACQLGDIGFDRFGNWHFAASGDSEMHDDWGVALQLPLGFPAKPYLAVDHKPHEFPLPFRNGLIDLSPPFGEKHDMLKTGVPEGFLRNGGYEIFVNWQYPDKRIIQQFGEWLRKRRERPAGERRGRSKVREMFADLKALGAYRLLKVMTAEQALAHTKQSMRYGLYAKIPDWYEAKTRAANVLKETFRSENEDTASKYLEQLDRETKKNGDKRRRKEAR